MSFRIGQTVGDYEIVGILGAGGMGSVYKVRNQISDRTEAMKILLPNLKDVPELGDRFLREIKVQGKLEHPNITALRTAVRVDDQLLMVMELVEGESLDHKLRKNGPLPVEQTINYCCQVLDALSYAHAAGIVHRDLKPGNIIVTPQGVVKLTDFGIARMGDDQKLTRTGAALGSLYYMAPEQIQGKLTDARSDVYSLGITMFELATGRRPFVADNEYAIMTAHLSEPPPNPLTFNPKLPPRMVDVLLRSLAKNPAERYQTAGEFRAALEGSKTGYYAPRPATVGTVNHPVPAGPQPNRKLRWMLRVASAATLSLLIAGLYFSRQASKAVSAPPPQTVAQSSAPVAPVVTPAPAAVPVPEPAAEPAAAEPEEPVSRKRRVREEREAPRRSRDRQSREEEPAAVAAPVPAVVIAVPQAAPQAAPAAAPPVVAQPAAPAAAPAVDARQQEWDRVKGSRDTGALEAFRRKHPDGPQAEQALRLIQQIEWDAVKSSGNLQQLRGYQEKYPNSPFAARAAAEADRMEHASAGRAVLDAVAEYKAAFESRDLSAVRALRPGLSAEQLKSIKETFRQARSIQMALKPTGEPTITGSTASVQCSLSQTVVMKNGDRPPAVAHNISIHFRKAGSGWVIDSIQ